MKVDVATEVFRRFAGGDQSGILGARRMSFSGADLEIGSSLPGARRIQEA